MAVLSSESRRDLVLAESLPELWFRKDSSSVETFGEGVGERRPTDCTHAQYGEPQPHHMDRHTYTRHIPGVHYDQTA